MLDLLRNRALVYVLGLHLMFFIAVSGLLILPKWLVGMGFSEGRIGILMGLPGLTALIFTFVVGQFLDRFDRITFIRAGLVLYLLVTLLLPESVHYGIAIDVVRLFQGIAFALTFPAAATLVVDIAPQHRRVQALGLFGVCTLSTQAISPGIGEWVAARWGFPVFFYVVAFTCVVSYGLSVLLKRELAIRPLPEDSGAADEGSQPVPPTRHPLYWPLLIYAGLVGSLFGAMLTFVPVMFLQFGATSISAFFVSCSGAAVFVRIFFGHVGDTADRDRVMLASGALAAFAVGMAAAVGYVEVEAGAINILAVLLGTTFGFGVGFFYPVANTRFIELGPDGQRGKYMSYYSTTYATGITAASFFYGFVAEWYGYGVMFTLAVSLAALGWIGYWLGRRRVFVPG